MGLVGIGWESGYFGEIGTSSNKTIDGYVVKHTHIFHLFKIPQLDNDGPRLITCLKGSSFSLYFGNFSWLDLWPHDENKKLLIIKD